MKNSIKAAEVVVTTAKGDYKLNIFVGVIQKNRKYGYDAVRYNIRFSLWPYHTLAVAHSEERRDLLISQIVKHKRFITKPMLKYIEKMQKNASFQQTICF